MAKVVSVRTVCVFELVMDMIKCVNLIVAEEDVTSNLLKFSNARV